MASFATLTLVLSPMIDPTASEAMAFEQPSPVFDDRGQTLAVGTGFEAEVSRVAFGVVNLPKPKPKPKPEVAALSSAPVSGTPDPGSAKAIALEMVKARGWNNAQYDCLVSLWNKESGWNVYASNPSSGAYGIPQALPGNKMATAGADWQTSARTQISWGLGYIQGRYTNPCGAWASSQSRGWY